MMLRVVPLLAATLLAQPQADRAISGEVVDRQGKPVAGAQVVFRGRPQDTTDPIEVRATSDALGAFKLNIPQLGRSLAREVNILAYRPGLAIGAVGLVQTPHRIVLHEPKPRTVKVEGPDGKPVAGARIAIRMAFHLFGGTLTDVPESLADSLATSTGPDGTATLNCLAARDQLVAVRILAAAIGSQDFLLVEQPGRSSEPDVVTIQASRARARIAGRIVDQDGKGVANHEVEVWSKPSAEWMLPSRVGFPGRPLRTAADGSVPRHRPTFMDGSTYRLVAIRASRATTRSTPIGSRSARRREPWRLWF